MGRPRTAVLSRDLIADQALAVVDERGDFSLPEVARRLGVKTASLYYHVDGRAGVIELLRIRMGDLLDLAPLELQPWDVALRGFLRSYRDVIAAHPRVVPLIATTTIRSPQVMGGYERLIGVLEQAGVAPDEVMTVVSALDSFVLGSALDSAAPTIMWEVSDGAATPRLQAALAAQPPTDDRADLAFEFGIDALLTAIRDGRQPIP